MRGAAQAHLLPHLRYLPRLTSKLVLYLSIPAALFVAFIVGYALRRLFQRWKTRARTSFGELFFAVLEELPIPLLLLTALDIALRVLVLPASYQRAGSKVILSLVVVVIFYFLTKVAVAFMRRITLREPALERVTQPAVFVIRILFVALAIVIILENLGIHLVAVWTTLGVGSVAIALGLQETLSNAFAGLYIMADQPVGPGDYVKLDSGHEGYVVRTGWRATSLRTLGNNVVFIPNSNLAKAVITNYSRPEERMSFSIAVSAAYGTDPRRVEQILVEIARQAARDGLEGLLAQPEPSASFIPGFGASSLDFSLNVQLRRFVDQYAVQSELRKRIIERFRKEGIDMPFPTRTLLFDKSALDSLSGRALRSSKNTLAEEP